MIEEAYNRTDEFGFRTARVAEHVEGGAKRARPIATEVDGHTRPDLTRGTSSRTHWNYGPV